MQKSKIEWTDRTWNPVTGCTKVSQGCKNCYAERLYERFNGHGSFKNVICHPERLQQPMKWKKPCKIFVNSMSDLFHEDVPHNFIANVFSIMKRCPWHTFQILTKRPERMLEILTEWSKQEDLPTLPNVWLGVSVEDQKTADERIPLLLQVPAAVRFLSCEPLLGEINLNGYLPDTYNDGTSVHQFYPNKIHWVIVGGESGPGARPMHPDWARSLRDQCKAASVPLFFKQWGEYVSLESRDGVEFCICADGDDPKFDGISISRLVSAFDCDFIKVGKKKAGNILEGKQYLQFPDPIF